MIASLTAVMALQNGDLAFRQRASEPRAYEALRIYRGTYQEDTANREAAWRLAMACYFVGLRFIKDPDERKKIYEEGIKAGRRSIEGDGECAACHFWTAINMALYGEAVGVFKMLFSLSEIREHLKESARIDPSYAFSGAYRLLGLIEQKLPGILGGSNQRARDFFEKAISTSPQEPLNYLFLANLLNDQLDEKKRALFVAQQGLSVPDPESDRLESREALASLRTLIAIMEETKK